MDEYIKQSIDARKNAFSASFEVSAEMQKKIDALFSEIEELGLKCKDVGEFETKFASSPLNQKYLDLFTEIATGSQAKAAMPKATKKALAGSIVGGIAESAAERAISTVKPTRAAINQHAHDAVSKVPVLGDALDIGQKASYAMHLGKVFGLGKKKKK